MLLAMKEKRFKDATWWLQYLEAKALELFVNLEESEDVFREAHPEFENEDLGRRRYKGNIGLKKKQPVTPDEFRAAYPNFVADSWWTYRSNDSAWNPKHELQWRLNQTWLREIWDARFGLDSPPSSMASVLTDGDEFNRILGEALHGPLPPSGARQARISPVSYEGRLFVTQCILQSIIHPEYVGYYGDGLPEDESLKKPVFGNVLEMDFFEGTYIELFTWLNSQPWRARTCICKRRFIASWPSNEHCSQHCAAIALREYKRKFRAGHAEQYNRDRRKARAKTHATRKRRSNLCL
jgi:hypothetical protein